MSPSSVHKLVIPASTGSLNLKSGSLFIKLLKEILAWTYKTILQISKQNCTYIYTVQHWGLRQHVTSSLVVYWHFFLLVRLCFVKNINILARVTIKKTNTLCCRCITFSKLLHRSSIKCLCKLVTTHWSSLPKLYISANPGHPVLFDKGEKRTKIINCIDTQNLVKWNLNPPHSMLLLLIWLNVKLVFLHTKHLNAFIIWFHLTRATSSMFLFWILDLIPLAQKNMLKYELIKYKVLAHNSSPHLALTKRLKSDFVSHLTIIFWSH